MSRRIVRNVVQLFIVAAACFILALFLDNRYSVLPTAIHNHLPAHHPGLVVTDITVTTCSTLNLLSSCRLDSAEWLRIEKDLYLGQGWVSAAYLHIKRKQEVELAAGDKVVLDVRVARKSPSSSEAIHVSGKWESRAGGIWIFRSADRHESDSKYAVTAIDVLFGPDAVEPRTGWAIKDTSLLLDKAVEGKEPRLTLRRGPVHKLEKPVLRIGKDGRFKIMQLADLHLSTGTGICRDAEPKKLDDRKCEADTRTLEFVGKLLDQEKPDLVVLTGDQINGDTAPDVQSAVLKYAELMIKRHIPYAAILGNHDDEGPLSRADSMSLMESLPYSLSEAGPSSISGVGNYVIEVLAPNSQHSALTLYLLDTHKYSPDEQHYRGYDWLKDDQIKWFKDTSKLLKPLHHKYTKIHMGMAFIHIPLPEYRKTDNLIIGEYREPVTAPGFNSHFKDALVEESILVVSCGHDHVNDYCSLERSPEQKPELWMCYGGGAGFGGYAGYGGYHRRVRFFEIDTNSARISTYKRIEYGATERKLDEQIVVEAGRVVAG